MTNTIEGPASPEENLLVWETFLENPSILEYIAYKTGQTLEQVKLVIQYLRLSEIEKINKKEK